MILIDTFRLIIFLPGGKIQWNDTQKFTQQDIDDFNKCLVLQTCLMKMACFNCSMCKYWHSLQ